MLLRPLIRLEVHQELGTKAAVIKAIGGSGTLAASLTAGTKCAAIAAPTGPVGSFLAGVACSLPIALVGDHLTDQVIEQEMEQEAEEAQVDDSWVPTQDQIENCQDYLDQANEKIENSFEKNDLKLI